MNAPPAPVATPLLSVRALTIDVPAPAAPGKYKLKFDLVYEGVAWFEEVGSSTTTKDLRVV